MELSVVIPTPFSGITSYMSIGEIESTAFDKADFDGFIAQILTLSQRVRHS